jgi:hypothetical protein
LIQSFLHPALIQKTPGLVSREFHGGLAIGKLPFGRTDAPSLQTLNPTAPESDAVRRKFQSLGPFQNAGRAH